MKPLINAARVALIAAAVLFTASVARGRQKDPTLAQCKADLDAWQAERRTDVRSTNLSWRELERRSNELAACIDVVVKGAENKVPEAMTVRVVEYEVLEGWYDLVLLTRLENFLDRHNLTNKFADEDQQGLR